MYGKIFASLYQGTLRGRAHEILVFTNLIAHADAKGYVDKHFKAIADEVGLAVDDVKKAIEALESEDPESRSPEMGGIRLARVDEHRAWGWRIVNYEKYRSIRCSEDRKEQNRIAQEKWRKQNKPSSAKVSQVKPESAQAEEEAYAEEDEKEEASKENAEPASPWLVAFGLELPESLRTQNCLKAVKLWLKHKGEKRDAYKPTGLKASLTKWGNEFTAAEFPSAVENAIAAGWKGIYKENKGFRIRKVGSGGMESGRELNDTSLESTQKL